MSSSSGWHRQPIKTDLFLEIAKGNVDKHSISFISGSNTGACTKYEDVWDVGELDSIDYDAQSANFTPGLVVTGGTSAATGVVVADTDGGTTGTLIIRAVNGIFENNEALTDSGSGAAVADGILLAPYRSMVYPTSGEQLELICENAGDTSAGTGARTVLLTYLDTSYVEQTETVSLNGTTAVLTSATNILRFRSAQVLTWGSATEPIFVKCNLGGIIIRDTASKAIRGFIHFDSSITGDEHGLNATKNSHFTVPAGATAFIMNVTGNTSKDHETDFLGMIRPFGVDGFAPLAQRFVYQSSINLDSDFSPLPIPAKADVKFSARSNNTKVPVNSTITLILVED